MATAKKWLRISLSVCGGILGLMSGVLSVIFGIIGLILDSKSAHPTATVMFFALAYVSMLVFGLCTAKSNYEHLHKKDVCDELEHLYEQLLLRIREIESRAPYFFYEAHPALRYEKDGPDPDTVAILSKINACLEQNLTRAWLVILYDQEGIVRTPHIDGEGTWNMNRWQDMLDVLKHQSKQLKKIITKQIDAGNPL
jgi:hypothetical protein